MKELMVVGFMLAYTAKGVTSDEQNAYNYASQAAYKASGLERTVDAIVQEQLRDVPKEVQSVVGNTYLIVKALEERKISFSLEFP